MLVFCPVLAIGEDQQIAAGETLAEACIGCHWFKGSGFRDFPYLAGQPAEYLERSLRAYRNGSRRSEVMMPFAKNLSDEQIADLAAYYSSLGTR